MFTRAISVSIRWHTQAQKHKNLLPPTCHCFSVTFPRACAYACVVPVITYDATTQAHAQAQENGNRSILLYLCLCLRRCVVRVNRDDASISTSASTRRLCLRRTGLHVGFLCLCLCLRRTCKPGLKGKCHLFVVLLWMATKHICIVGNVKIKVQFC